jgi:hypothetical protein
MMLFSPFQGKKIRNFTSVSSSYHPGNYSWRDQALAVKLEEPKEKDASGELL